MDGFFVLTRYSFMPVNMIVIGNEDSVQYFRIAEFTAIYQTRK